MNGTKLSLKYEIISGPFGNTEIKTEINGKPEKLPFEEMYLKESPKEVLSFLIKNYLITKYLDIDPTSRHNSLFGDVSQSQFLKYKGHLITNFGLSIQHFGLDGITINNSIYKYLNLSFLPKYKIENPEENIKNLIETYIVRTDIFKEYPSSDIEKTSTSNYFKDRKNKVNELKEKQLSQIIDYAQIILDKSNFSIKDLEAMVSEKAVSV